MVVAYTAGGWLLVPLAYISSTCTPGIHVRTYITCVPFLCHRQRVRCVDYVDVLFVYHACLPFQSLWSAKPIRS